MSTKITLTLLGILLLTLIFSCASGFDKTKISGAKNTGDVYSLLSGSMLSKTKLVKLGMGVVLQTEKFTLTEKDLNTVVSKSPKDIQDQLSGNLVFLLEQQAIQKCLLEEAKLAVKTDGKDVEKMQDDQIIQEYFGMLTGNIKSTVEEARLFYHQNKSMVGEAKYEDIEPQILKYLDDLNKQTFIDNYIKDIGSRSLVAVSDLWIDRQYGRYTNNTVDRARTSGLPAIIDFGSYGCGPCDMMTPILEKLGKKYTNRIHVLFVSVKDYQILAARYGISSIPVQVFFDAQGKEIYRHTGFYPENDIEKNITDFKMLEKKEI